jgi:DNA-binding FadR family transcriptional regulator
MSRSNSIEAFSLQASTERRGSVDTENLAKPGELFAAVRRVRSFDDVVRQIRDAVLNGRVPPGERLPSERELALQLGVSRPTLREGMRALEAAGLIEIRLGGSGGIYASAPDGQLIGSALESLMHIRDASRWDLQEFRRAFEPENAALAALRATDVNLDALYTSVGALTSAIADDRDEVVIASADFALHEAVAIASHNEVRIAIMIGIGQATQRTTEALAATTHRDRLRIAAEELELMVRAIDDVDPEAARRHMLNHLTTV